MNTGGNYHQPHSPEFDQNSGFCTPPNCRVPCLPHFIEDSESVMSGWNRRSSYYASGSKPSTLLTLIRSLSFNQGGSISNVLHCRHRSPPQRELLWQPSPVKLQTREQRTSKRPSGPTTRTEPVGFTSGSPQRSSHGPRASVSRPTERR